MKVLLRETVEKLGTIGDIVAVPDGYGRNYLLPKGIALTVTPDNMRRLDAKKADLLAAEAQRRAEAEGLAGKLRSQTVVIQAKAMGEEGHLYGSVTALRIAENVSKLGVPVEARMILLDHPIKELGAFNVRIRLFPQIEVEVKLHIVDESLTAAQQSDVIAAHNAPPKPAAEKLAKFVRKEEGPLAEEAAANAAAAAAEGATAEKKPKKAKKAKEESAEGSAEEPVAVGADEGGKKGKKSK